MKALLAELKVVLRTQRKKAGMLLALTAIFLAMVAKTMGPQLFGSGPQTAAAGVAGGAADTAVAADAALSTEARLSAARTVRVPQPPPLTRDLFAYNRAYFPLPAAAGPGSEAASKSGLQKQPKSGAEAVEDKQAAAPSPEELAAAIRAEAKTIALRSLIIGAEPLAVLEATAGQAKGVRELVGLGAEFLESGFVVKQIAAGMVVLEKDGVLVELKRAQP